MAKWHYPKWRRVAMQAVLFVILGASVALAQWIVHDHQVNGSTRLAGMRSYGPIGIRIPAGWSLKSESVQPGLAPKWVNLTAVETGPVGRPGRALVVAEREESPTLTALEFLNLRPEDAGVPIKIGPYQGILTDRMVLTDTLMAPDMGPAAYQLVAGCVGNTGIAIKLVLNCPIDPEADRATQRQQRQDDVLLLQEIARAIVVETNPSGQ